ncbi:unnamed protein product [Trifolium pratense]|uniref:Uncharacterized protein n=1 Tax=Trifolium pratense TaxID=57577 RepID=A0ACB0J8J7_TRIPR|nr:unnamed protein product [Trifolium pratense]
MGSKGLDVASELVGFMDGLPVKSLHQLLNSDSHGVCIVAAFFDSVVEGVDLWFNDDQSRDHPRFRMKMKVTHGDDVAVFSVFDKEVQKLAIETCPLMLSMICGEKQVLCLLFFCYGWRQEFIPSLLQGESCSLYPDEMEVLYGESYVWKVEPRDSHDFEKLPSFKVQSICNNAGVVDKFFEEYAMDPRTFVHPQPDLSSDHAYEASILCNSSCGSNDVACVDADLVVSPPFMGARVLKKWKAAYFLSSGGSSTVELVLIDKNGHKIQASIANDLVAAFDDQIVEGGVYQISFLNVGFNFGFYLPSYHRYKFDFNENSKVVPFANDLLPTYGLSLISFESVLKRTRYRHLVGRTLVVGVEGVTRIFANLLIHEIINYRNWSLQYSGLLGPIAHVPLSQTLEFLRDYPVRTIVELKANPELGVYIVNARICDIVKIDPWWFATCKCPRIYQKYLGDFHCEKCNARKFTAAPMVRLTFEVDDETGFALFEGFDSVLVSIAAPESSFKGLSTDKFYKAFRLIMGKSIMFIVRKIVHQTVRKSIMFFSGITSILLPGGRTAHSQFGIPLNLTKESCCKIVVKSDKAQLLAMASLIIWDEAPMISKFAFEAFERTLQDVMTDVDVNNANLLFGGKTVVFGGDFSQILPVIPKGTRADIVYATINSSYLWCKCRVLKLTQNMRLQYSSDPVENENLAIFAKWLLDIGDGKIGVFEDGDMIVEIPPDILVPCITNPIGYIVDSIYPSLLKDMYLPNFFEDRAILAPTLEIVEQINDYVLSLIPSDSREYLSCDSVSRCDKDAIVDHRWITTEFLNEIKCSGLPNHRLILKIGVPVMLLRNIDVSSGLCNGTRLIVTHLGFGVFGARVVSGRNIGSVVFIPRMRLLPSDATVSICFQRLQFPLCVCFAMSINKSQGQTLSHVGLYLPRSVFTHGQLYVALSRVKTRSGLKVMVTDVVVSITYLTSFTSRYGERRK